MASTHLSRTPSSAGNKKTFTFSAWIKKSGLSTSQYMYCSLLGNQNRYSLIRFTASDEISIYSGVYTSGSSTTLALNLTTTRVFRDPSAFLHIVVAIDTTQATDTNRVKLYINGVQETSFSTATYPSQNTDTFFNSTDTHRVGSYDGSSEYFDGSMAHVHFTDGYAYDASTFGETDSTSGIWKPKTAPSVTYGTNGFFLKFENSGAMGTDSSGNTNTFTVSGNLTQNVDTPSNNLCTLNAINPYGGTLSNGNLKISQSSYEQNTQGTLGMESGKYYWEVKMGGLHAEIGIAENSKAGQSDPQVAAGFRFIYSNGSAGVVVYNNATGSSGTTNSGWTNFASGQIIGVAYDADNGKLYFHNNGTYYNSGNPAGGTGAVITSISPQYGGVMVPFLGSGTGSARTHEINFGSGYFGTTQVASAGTAPSQGGIFEFDCPSGYESLSSKGINSF
jgi:hypothetical protein